MLNSFPDLLVYSTLAPLFLRVVVGFLFLDLGILKFHKENAKWLNSFKSLSIPKPEMTVKVVGGLEIIGGILLIGGLFTQIASLSLSVLSLIAVFIEYRDPPLLKRTLVFYILLFTITLSLLFSGAGKFAFDMPL